jgi:hypothetical protein
MVDHEWRMCAYVQLAVLSDEKRQALARDRFLLLAGAEACGAGWLDVAGRCRALLLASNPHHQAAKFGSLPAALRDAEFQRLVAQQEHRCPAERAEHLLAELGLDPRGDSPQPSPGPRMLELLAKIAIENKPRTTEPRTTEPRT